MKPIQRLVTGLTATVVLAVAWPALANGGVPSNDLHSVGSATETRFTDNTFTTTVAQARAGAPKPADLHAVTTIEVTEFADNSFSDNAMIGQANYNGRGELVKKWGVVKGGPVTKDGRAILSKGSGSGGTSTASGCHRVTVTNRETTTLGFTAFKLVSWTDSCWNRAPQTVSVYVNDAQMQNVDPQYQYDSSWLLWDGLFYDYGANDGHPYSAFRFRAQKKVTNCVLKYGCLGTYYPLNVVRSYYNGTWAWETS